MRMTAAMFALCCLAVSLEAQNGNLESLRREHCEHYFEPEAHLRLAKEFVGLGKQRIAFDIMETARRRRLPEKVFDEAYRKVFVDKEPFDPSPAAEQKLLAELAKKPADGDLNFKIADIYISRSDWKKARVHLQRVIDARPDDFEDARTMARVMAEDGQKEAGEQMLKDWLAAHPDSVEAWEQRVADVPRGDDETAEKVLVAAIEKFPKTGSFLFRLAYVRMRKEKLDEAEELFAKAAAASPESPMIQGWAGRFALRGRKDEAKALEYYYRAYFLDPHFYDTEYAEYRVTTLSRSLAQRAYQAKMAGGAKLRTLLTDPDPDIVLQALDEFGKKLDPTALDDLVQLMRHDSPTVRASAMVVLMANPGSEVTKKMILAVRGDPDARCRGLAMYVVMKHDPTKATPLVAESLRSGNQLLRFDAVCSLMESGGTAGKALVAKHMQEEKHPWLKDLYEKMKDK